jgi:cob(I)alamin adenosyltransferase
LRDARSRAIPSRKAEKRSRRSAVSDTERGKPPVSTGGGDDGTTTLMGAGRMSKSDARITLLGDLDEASSFLGLARADAHSSGDNAAIHDLLLDLQRLLYRLMGDIAMPGEADMVGADDVAHLDEKLEEWRSRTELPREFVIPGESRLGALLDVSRSIVRRAERTLVAAGHAEGHPQALKAVNRLSDLLFIVARNADGTYALSKGSGED